MPTYASGMSSDPVRDAYAESVAEYGEVRERQRGALLAARTANTGVAPLAGRDELATLAEVGSPGNVADLYARLIATATERVQLYGRQLAAAYAAQGLDALRRVVYVVDPSTGSLESNGEKPTALVLMELKEREMLERLIVQGARLGLEQRAQDALSRNGAVLAGAMRRFAEASGREWADPETRRQAQRALLEARAEVEREERSE